MVNIGQLLDECALRLERRYSTVCGIVESDDFVSGNARVLRLCIVVNERVVDRARWRVSDVPIDLFIMTRDHLVDAIERGAEQNLVQLCASGRPAFGDAGCAASIVALAHARLGHPAPAPSPATVFRFQCQPFDLLRKFHAVRDRDRAEASLIAASLIRTVVEGYVALNRLWSLDNGKVLGQIAGINAGAAQAIIRVMDLPLMSLSDHPELLTEMVNVCIGKEASSRESWIDRQAAPAPVSRPISQKPVSNVNIDPMPLAIRSYTSWAMERTQTAITA